MPQSSVLKEYPIGAILVRNFKRMIADNRYSPDVEKGLFETLDEFEVASPCSNTDVEKACSDLTKTVEQLCQIANLNSRRKDQSSVTAEQAQVQLGQCRQQSDVGTGVGQADVARSLLNQATKRIQIENNALLQGDNFTSFVSIVHGYTKTQSGSQLSLPRNLQHDGDDVLHFLAVAVPTVKEFPHISYRDLTREYDEQFKGRSKAKSHFTNRHLRMDHIHEIRALVFPDPDCVADRGLRSARKARKALLYFGEFIISRIRQKSEPFHQPNRRDRLLKELFDEYSKDSFRAENKYCLAKSVMANTNLNNTTLWDIAALELSNAEAAERLAQVAKKVASAAFDRAGLANSGGSGGFGGGGGGGGGGPTDSR